MKMGEMRSLKIRTAINTVITEQRIAAARSTEPVNVDQMLTELEQQVTKAVYQAFNIEETTAAPASKQKKGS